MNDSTAVKIKEQQVTIAADQIGTQGQPPYTWERILDLVLQHKGLLIKAHIIAILATLATVPLPLLLPLLVDEVLLNDPGWIVAGLQSLAPQTWHGAIYYIVAITIFTIILRAIGVGLGVWQMQQFTVIAKDVTYRIRRDLLARVKGVSMAQYETLGTGSVNATLVNDVNTIDTFIGTTVGKLIVALLSLVGMTLILIWLHWQLAVFILLMNPLVVYFTMRMGRHVKALKKSENSALDAFQQSLSETLEALQQVRAANRDSAFFDRVRGKAQKVKQHSEAFTWKSDAASRVSFLIFLVGFDIFRGVSMLMVVFSDLSIGQMMAVFGYLWFMMGPVQELLAIQYSYNAADGGLSRINSVLNLQQEGHYHPKVQAFQADKKAKVEVHDLVFHYPGKQQRVLDGLSFTLNPGEKLALVGASGGGKTTLVSMLLGFYQPASGQILYNGHNIRDIGYEPLREKVATVLQTPMLFNQSVRFNLTLGRDLSDQACWDALAMAQLDTTIGDLPEQLDTELGRNGIKLSGGQRQRLAIARMILQNPKVVIMDEATSALDMATERQLYEDLAPFFAERTTLIVAHRLSSIKQADRILVFEDGKIIETGDHESLLKQQGTYHKLYR